MRRPRFQSRPLFRSFAKGSRQNTRKLSSFLLKISQKDVILDYVQLRIGCFHFLLKALPKGSYVATSCYTIFDMVNVIINAGHIPYFVDIDKENLGPNVDELIDLIKSQKVQAVIYTYLHGYKEDLTRLAECCKANNCILIEDCAQSLWNTTWDSNGITPGSYGDAAIFSSGFFKNINTINGGHLVFKKDANFANNIINSHKSLKHKVTFDFIYRTVYAVLFKLFTTDLVFNFILFPVLQVSWAKNFVWMNKRAREENNPKYIKRDESNIIKMNLLQKFLFKYQNQEALDRDYYKKSKLADIYLLELKELIDKNIISIPGLKEKNGIYSLKGTSSYNQIPVLALKRKLLLDFLIAEGFDIAAQHIRNLSETPPYDNYQSNEVKVTNDVINKIVLLPCYPNYPEKNIFELCKKIKKFYA
tara:strand:+ start:3352 stop:4605 length:1254 start_codon:yes stop_codon:yes gene_type:complete